MLATAKVFTNGNSQAIRLPKAFRFPGSEVVVEKRGDEVVLRALPKRKLRTLADVARYMASLGGDFPDRVQPRVQERDLSF